MAHPTNHVERVAATVTTSTPVKPKVSQVEKRLKAELTKAFTVLDTLETKLQGLDTLVRDASQSLIDDDVDDTMGVAQIKAANIEIIRTLTAWKEKRNAELFLT